MIIKTKQDCEITYFEIHQSMVKVYDDLNDSSFEGEERGDLYRIVIDGLEGEKIFSSLQEGDIEFYISGDKYSGKIVKREIRSITIFRKSYKNY